MTSSCSYFKKKITLLTFYQDFTNANFIKTSPYNCCIVVLVNCKLKDLLGNIPFLIKCFIFPRISVYLMSDILQIFQSDLMRLLVVL